MSKNNKVTLIVPVWVNSEDSFKMTKQAIDDMLATEYDNFDIVIVDDCSPFPGVYDQLFHLYANHPLIHAIAKTPENGGSTVAVNYGITLTDSPFIQYQNTDTRFPHRNWLAEQMKFSHDPEVGVIGCLMRFENGYIQHCGAAWRNLDDHSIDHVGHWQQEVHLFEDVPFVTGCGMTVRREILERNGGGFTVFPGYGWDDIDIQVKAKKWGYKIKIAQRAEFIHLGSASYKERPELANADYYRMNREHFQAVPIEPEDTIQYFIDKYYIK